MVYAIVIFVVIVALFWSGVFDTDEEKKVENYIPNKEMVTPDPWKYNKYTAQLYFDIYVSEPSNGKYFILKIGENMFAALDVVDYPPDSTDKNQLLLEMDNRVYDFPEQNLSSMLGPCKINQNDVKIYFADKSAYHSGISVPPFEYMSLEGQIRNKKLVFDIKQKYFDQSYGAPKIITLKENVYFHQL